MRRNLSQEPIAGTVIGMTPDEALAALDELRAAREAGDQAVKDTPKAVVDALAAGNTAAEVARRIGMSEGYVRKFRREAGLQDKRYAHLKPPVAAAEPVLAPQAPGARKPKLSPNVARLDPMQAARVAALAESHADGGWAARVIAEYPGLSANWHSYVVVEAGLHRGFIEDTDLPA
jgi:hypothetical protein